MFLLSSIPCCYWFTGLSGAGKSTLAHEVKSHLKKHVSVVVLDGDTLRLGLNNDLGFCPEDRAENVRRIAHVARLFVEAGAVVLVAVIAPYQDDRQKIRTILKDFPYFEVFVDAPLSVCKIRDPKGLYARSIDSFTGVSAPYESPTNPDIWLKTQIDDVQACTQIILKHHQGLTKLRND